MASPYYFKLLLVGVPIQLEFDVHRLWGVAHPFGDSVGIGAGREGSLCSPKYVFHLSGTSLSTDRPDSMTKLVPRPFHAPLMPNNWQ